MGACDSYESPWYTKRQCTSHSSRTNLEKTSVFLNASNLNQRLLLDQLLDTRISKHNCNQLNLRLYFGSSVSSKLSSYYSKRTKSIIFQYGCFLAKYFCEYLLLFFNKPVYSCKDTTNAISFILVKQNGVKNLG